jgi:pimeloyl-ACP methyl ester carboxylesterase
VVSDIPTLILAGEYDPITPPAYGREVARHLSRSYYFLFPGWGHGEAYVPITGSTCGSLIVSAFEDHPDQRPSGACIEQMTEPIFQ